MYKFVSKFTGVAMVLYASAAFAEMPLKQVPVRGELHPIPSLSLSDAEFLKGEGGKPITVAGQLRVAQGNGKLPLVILMHGSSGIGPNIDLWERTFNEMGVSTFAIDGMTGRGLTQVGTQQAVLGRLNFIIDIYRSLEVLAKHPRVDPEKIILMGFSRGGQATLYASLERFHALWNKSGARFAAYIPFYPDCATRYATDTEVGSKPIRIFHGTPDDYNPVSSCKAYVERLKTAGRDVTLTEYADAPHGFDTPLSNASVVAKGSQTVRACSIEERSPGQLVNAATGQAFSYSDACVAVDPHVGGNTKAREAAVADVTAFVRKVFALP